MNIVTGSGNVASKPPLPGSGETKSSVKEYLEPIRGRGLRANGTELRRVLDEAVKVTKGQAHVARAGDGEAVPSRGCCGRSWGQGREGTPAWSGACVTDLSPPPSSWKHPIVPIDVDRL